jgi:hypothetical protein
MHIFKSKSSVHYMLGTGHVYLLFIDVLLFQCCFLFMSIISY